LKKRLLAPYQTRFFCKNSSPKAPVSHSLSEEHVLPHHAIRVSVSDSKQGGFFSAKLGEFQSQVSARWDSIGSGRKFNARIFYGQKQVQ